MKRFYCVCVVVAACVASVVVASCGSSWNVSGNNITVTVAAQDTVVPAGTILLTKDSL